MGSTEGNEYVGRHGSAIPAVTSAQQVYFDYWTTQERRRHTVLRGAQRTAHRRARRRRLRRRKSGASNRISTRCSWAAAMSRRRCADAQDAANAAARR